MAFVPLGWARLWFGGSEGRWLSVGENRPSLARQLPWARLVWGLQAKELVLSPRCGETTFTGKECQGCGFSKLSESPTGARFSSQAAISSQSMLRVLHQSVSKAVSSMYLLILYPQESYLGTGLALYQSFRSKGYDSLMGPLWTVLPALILLGLSVLISELAVFLLQALSPLLRGAHPPPFHCHPRFYRHGQMQQLLALPKPSFQVCPTSQATTGGDHYGTVMLLYTNYQFSIFRQHRFHHCARGQSH